MTAIEHRIVESRAAGKVLIVEDHEDIAVSLRDNLAMDGHLVRIASTGVSALQLARMWAPHVVILDLALPDIDGYQVLRRMRRDELDAAVLVLSARDSQADKLVGFRLGADDYVSKPFGMLELLARVGVLLRRTEGAATPPIPASRDVLRAGDVFIDRDTRSVRRGNEDIVLAPKEFDLLQALVRRGGAVAQRKDLVKEIWGYSNVAHSRTLDTHIAQLRRKLEADPARPRLILTAHKNGYRVDFGD